VKIELARSTDEEKQSQLRRLRQFQERNRQDGEAMLARLRQAAINNENLFAVLVDAVRCCSLGQITTRCFEVGGSIAEYVGLLDADIPLRRLERGFQCRSSNDSR